MRRFRPYLKYLLKVRGPLIGAIVAGLIYGLASGAGLPLMIKKVFPRIFSADAAALTTTQLLLIASWIPVIFFIRGIAGFLNSYLIQMAGVRVLEALRFDYFRKLQLLPLAFIQRQTSGDLISRGIADTNQLQFSLTTIANDGLKQPAALLGSIGFLIWAAFNEKGIALVLVCLALIPLCVFPIRYVGRKLLARATQIQAQLGNVTDRFAENLSAAREVRAFGLEDRQSERFAIESRQLITYQLKAVKYAQALTPAIEIISAVGLAVTLVYAYKSGVGLDSFLAIFTALYASYEPVKKLGSLNNEIKRGTSALERLEMIFNEPLGITDPVKPVTVNRLQGQVTFGDVGFAYKPGSPVLQHVGVEIPAGTVCALVGPSGAGKSTFANLVPRFYDATAGAVKIDGIDVRDMRLADLRANIAVVSQDPVLFNDTIYSNLLIGRLDATRAEVIAAARAAHADEFIRQLPQGYDTIVGERGALVSGGQKQRIALARAFLRNAPILILDEATSALDSQSEQMIQDALQHLVVGKTVFIIAHRFSTIRDASMILVFNQGRIVASGNHASLYADNPLYRSLYDNQHALGG
ncbi:MAG: ABC transporter ATP-binding protein [Cephaloticoccus sp.]|nr:ABC transporter ATP-binding protein [Cephaloticoccus sp.]